MESNVIEKNISVTGVNITSPVNMNNSTENREVKVLDGRDMYKGDDGYTPIKGVDYFDGEDGYTPVKGVDYFTDEDKQEIVDELKSQGGGIVEETDPTVPNWAKQPNKPTYTASEVGALPNTIKIPTKTSDLSNDSGFLTGIPSEYVTESELSAKKYLTSIPSEYVTDSELDAKGYLTQHQDLSAYAKKTEIPTKPSDIGAEASGTAENKVSAHNTNTSAHNDIRLVIQELTERMNALANSDDTTLDQMAEVVAYIKNNRTLIESVTTEKVNVADIINNLTTNVANKPLSSAQGVVLKGLIDTLQATVNGIKVPTKTSELSNDSGFLTAIPSEYVTETELTAKKYLTSVPSEYVTDSELSAKGYAKQTEVDELSEEIADLKAKLVDGNEVAY